MKDLFNDLNKRCRPFTEEELAFYKESLDSLFEPTGRNLFELEETETSSTEE